LLLKGQNCFGRGKHTVHNNQPLIRNDRRDAGTRTRITHRKNAAINYSERGEKHSGRAEEPHVCGPGATNRLHQPLPNTRSVTEAAKGDGQGHPCSEKGGRTAKRGAAQGGNPFLRALPLRAAASEAAAI